MRLVDRLTLLMYTKTLPIEGSRNVFDGSNNLFSVRFCRETIAMTLINAGADASLVDCDGKNALHTAAREGLSKVINRLLEDDMVPIDAQDKKLNTALHYASIENDTESCRILLGKNASPDVANEEGETPLHIAARENCLEITEALIQSKRLLIKQAGRCTQSYKS